ncbi:MAG: ABC transporter ATP-binding protein, partial [Phenylobacterium sp.]|nr:ABC transporter ATP-binding protein [Phenylobacterium sp.]
RHDPQAPHRFGSSAVYDFPLTGKNRRPPAEILALAAREPAAA